jgi:hypothetical protein
VVVNNSYFLSVLSALGLLTAIRNGVLDHALAPNRGLVKTGLVSTLVPNRKHQLLSMEEVSLKGHLAYGMINFVNIELLFGLSTLYYF